MDEVRTLSEFIRTESFPCVMAKAVEKVGGITIATSHDLLDETERIHSEFSQFIDKFRQSEKLGSFILMCDKEKYESFEKFETDFWKFLKFLRSYDRKLYPHDPRVAEDPRHDDFSFSVKSEAFFILLLHPQSPRWSRRFSRPAIVFNPHVQFERLREKGMFKKVQAIIRRRDKLLQGEANPMLSDYGERSEVFQYVGRVYSPQEEVPIFY